MSSAHEVSFEALSKIACTHMYVRALAMSSLQTKHLEPLLPGLEACLATSCIALWFLFVWAAMRAANCLAKSPASILL